MAARTISGVEPAGVDRATRRRMVDSVNLLNSLHHDDVGDPEIATRIEQYELAYRMQASAPEAVDLSKETEATKKLYGFGNRC